MCPAAVWISGATIGTLFGSLERRLALMAGYCWRGGSSSEDEPPMATPATPAKAGQQPATPAKAGQHPDAFSAAQARVEKFVQDTLKTPEKLNQEGKGKDQNKGRNKDTNGGDKKDNGKSTGKKESKKDNGKSTGKKESKKDDKKESKKDDKSTGKKRQEPSTLEGEVKESQGKESKDTPRKRPAAVAAAAAAPAAAAAAAPAGPAEAAAAAPAGPADALPAADKEEKPLPRTFAGRERPTGADLQFLWDELKTKWPVLKETMGPKCVDQVTLWNEVRDLFFIVGSQDATLSQDDKLNQALTRFAKNHGCDLLFTNF